METEKPFAWAQPAWETQEPQAAEGKPPGPSMEGELNCTPASELDKFIEDHLLPDSSFHNEVKATIDILCSFLKERCFRGADHPVRVSKVVKGGSSGKSKIFWNKWEADLVVFLKNVTSFEDQLKQRGQFIQEIKRQLCELQKEKTFQLKFEVQSSKQPNSHGLSFKLSSPQIRPEVEFDVLLAYDVLGDVSTDKKPDPYVYRRLIKKCTSLGLEGEFSTCFTELQGNFLKDRPPKLKNLIRLVKHWYQLCKEKLREPLPPQYALELLTVYAWEGGSRAPEFNTAEGFRTVLELVTNYRQLRIYWTTYYDFRDQEVTSYLHEQLSRARPVILDPADPTWNVAAGNSVGWWLLAGEAVAWLQYPCVMNSETFLVYSWDVPIQDPVPKKKVDENEACVLL